MKQKLPITLLLSLTGAALNFIPAPYETEAVFAFGFALSVLVGLLWGNYYALLSIAIIASPIMYLQPDLEIVLLSIQTLLISQFGRRKSTSYPINISIAYWILLATPIQFVYVYFTQAGFYENDAATLLANGINGLAVGLLGHAAFLLMAILNLHKQIQSIKMAFLFRYFFTVLFFFSIMVLSYFFIGMLQSEQLDDLQAYLTQRSNVVADQLDDYLDAHASAIALSTTAIQENRERIQSRLTDTAVSFPDFLTMLVTDEHGDIINTFPESMLTKAQESGQTNVAARDYFYVPKQQSRLYVSPVFRGKGFGTDPILAISAPFYDENLNFAGIVEGSLNLAAFRLYDQREFRPSVSTVVADATGSIVYASESLGIEPLTQMAQPDCQPRQCDIDLARTLDPKDWVIAGGISDLYGWQVYKVYPRSIFVHQLTKYVSLGLLIIVMLSLLANIASYLVANTFSSPLAKLLDGFNRFDPSNPKQSHKSTKQTDAHYLSEISQLDTGFQGLTERLVQMFYQLNTARAEQLRLNDELQSLNASLEKRVKEKTESLEIVAREALQANEAKSQFLANVSHELRTPMNGIIGSVQNMQSQSEHLNVTDRRKLEVIHKSAQSLMALLNSILDWSKIEAGKMQLDEVSFNPMTMLESCILLHRSVAEEKLLQLRFLCDDSIPTALLGDETKIVQIVNNLLTNALKFTEQGFVTIKASYKHNQFEVEVRDSGIGIRKSEQEKVLNEFTQEDASTTRVYGGTGLGLPICRALAALMGGRLRLDSTVGVGTTVVLTLPLHVAEAGPEVEPAELTDQHTLPSGSKILLAEDNDINAEVVQDMLANQDIKIIRVPNGEIAVTAMQNIDFDLVLMDCQMPVLDGYQATQRIRSMAGTKGEVPIIALTANAYKEDRQRCLDAGMNDHLAKPIDRDKLLNTLSVWLGTRTSTEELA